MLVDAEVVEVTLVAAHGGAGGGFVAEGLVALDFEDGEFVSAADCVGAPACGPDRALPVAEFEVDAGELAGDWSLVAVGRRGRRPLG